ncbi:MAG TPA: hypothetical protein VIJ49_10810 [Aestuariivirga sp.]
MKLEVTRQALVNNNESDIRISNSWDMSGSAHMENEVLPQNDESAVTMMQIVIVQAGINPPFTLLV